MAYKMVAEREDEIVRNQRNSALVILANARVWASEGWRVTITAADGNEFDPAGFEKLLEQTYSTSFRAIYLPTQDAQAAEWPYGTKSRAVGFERLAAASQISTK